MTAISVITLAGLLLGLTGTALAADNRVAYFGDPATDPDGHGVLAVSPVTAGGVFTFDVLARNTDNQSLTHAFIGLGSGVTARDGWDNQAKPSLPPGSQILSATADGVACPITANRDGATCDIGKLASGDESFASFIVQAPAHPTSSWVYASLRVAENNPNRGSNNNSFFADSALNIGPTNSDNNSTFRLANQALTLGTAGQTAVPGDKMKTKVEVPNGLGGLISLVETNGPTGCPNSACIGQELSANVRGGAPLTPYLRWTLDIVGLGAGSGKGGILHTLDNGQVIDIRFLNANKCTTKKPVNCIESYVVNKKLGTTQIVFRTDTNGKVRAN